MKKIKFTGYKLSELRNYLVHVTFEMDITNLWNKLLTACTLEILQKLTERRGKMAVQMKATCTIRFTYKECLALSIAFLSVEPPPYLQDVKQLILAP